MTDEQSGASAPVAAAVSHARGETDEDLRQNEILLHRKITTALIPPALSGSLLPAIAAVAGTRTARKCSRSADSVAWQDGWWSEPFHSEFRTERRSDASKPCFREWSGCALHSRKAVYRMRPVRL